MKKYKRGITFGAFDTFHRGHAILLDRIKEQCEEVIVCISDDEYVRAIKKTDPAVPFEKRKKIVKAISLGNGLTGHVDRQSLNYTKADAVKKWKPDAIFVGDDWTPKTFGGEGLGIPVIYLPRTKGISSTQLKNKIQWPEK